MRQIHYQGEIPNGIHPEATNVFFSPFQDCQQVVLDTLGKAEKEVLVACFGLQSKPIADKLGALHARGVLVRICVDHMQSAGPHDLTRILKEQGIEVVVKPTHALLHNKVMVIDRSVVVTGSWNFSASANAQDNNVEIITQEPDVTNAFVQDWEKIYARDTGK